MTRAYVRDVPLPDDDDFLCECGAVEEFGVEFCASDRCPMCCAEQECHVECSVCHRLTDEFEVDEGVDPTCVDCLVAADEAAAGRAERDEAMLEAKGDEMREMRRARQ